MALQLLGIVSAIATVFAYYLVTSGKTFPTSKLYLGLNLFGSGTAIVYTALLFAWASVFVQVFWVCITLKTLYDVRRMSLSHAQKRDLARLKKHLRALDATEAQIEAGDLRQPVAT